MEEKWIYNKETNEVWEEVFEDGSSIVGHKRAIPKNVKVEWRDGDDVTRKFKKQHQELRSDWCNVDEETYNEAGEKYRRIVAIPIKQEQPANSVLRDFAGKVKAELKRQQEQPQVIQNLAEAAKVHNKFYESENQSQPILQDNVMSYQVQKLVDIRNELYDNLPTGEIKAFDLITVIKWHVNDLDNYASLLNNFINEQQDRITSLETANAFHKKEAEDAVLEQHRLIKENTTLLEVIQEQERAKDILINRIEGLRNGIK